LIKIPLNWIDVDNLLNLLKGLADGTRLKILNLLLTRDLCVGALAHQLDVSTAAVSQHLQTLRKAGLVRGEKRGYWTHYSVDRAVLHQMAEDLIRMADQTPAPEGCCFHADGNKESASGS
jgi:DNA-binding transcriptional ArsR family regulator